MTKMKKLTSLFLAVAMATGLMAPAMASEKEDAVMVATDKACVMDAAGNEMAFETVYCGNGVYLLYYYFNGELQTTYTLSGEAQIEAKTVDGQTYTVERLDTRNVVQEVELLSPEPKAVTTHFATIRYKTNSTFTSTPAASVETTGTVKTMQIPFTAEKNSKFSDAVAQVSAEIIAICLAFAAPSGGSSLALVATTVVTGMIAAAGGQIVNDIITAVVSDWFNCVETAHSYNITLITNKFTKTGKLNQVGYSDSVYYDDVDELEATYSGYTPASIQNGKESSFAREVWMACTSYAYPGLSSYTYY